MSLEENTIYLIGPQATLPSIKARRKMGGREDWPMVGRRGVEVRDDGPTLAPRPYTPTVGVRLPSVKVRKGGSQGQHTRGSPEASNSCSCG